MSTVRPKSPWWLFAYYGAFGHQDRPDITIRDVEWWKTLPHRLRSRALRGLTRAGLWDVLTEGGYLWQDGRFRVELLEHEARRSRSRAHT